jgi:hypothetical protein
MRQLTIGAGPAATLLVAGDPDNPVPTLIQNIDPSNVLYIGKYVGVNPANPLECAPLNPGQTTIASGDINIFGIAAPGQTVAINVYEGVMSFFQPVSQLALAGPASAIVLYSPFAGQGNVVGSWAAQTYVDPYQNTIEVGLNASQGTLASMILQACLLQQADIETPLINNATVNAPTVTGGTIVETEITFDTTDGFILMYATTTTTVTFSTGGSHTDWPSPVTGPANVKCWGGDAGAGGGNASRGGEGGGGGGYGGEANYQLIQGQVYGVDVGQAGQGGNTGQNATSGGDSGFDNYAVIGPGGQAGGNFIGGLGGSNTKNTYHFPGGNGGGNGTQGTGGCGGGGRAGSTGPGGNGQTSSGSSGASGGSSGTGIGGHAGANGGANAANGNNGPGGGGGCGAATSAQTGQSQYALSQSATYYGSDAGSYGGSSNGQRNTGTMYQGGTTASGGGFNGTMKSLGLISGNPQSDLSGKTIDSVTIRLECDHSWYSAGITVLLGYNSRTSLPSSWDASDITSVSRWQQASDGNPRTTDITGAGLGTAMQNGAAKAITLGPGPLMNLNNYGYFYGAGGVSSEHPLITVNWHTGSQPVKAGNGGAGMVTVTYTNTQTLIGAMSPVIGSDPAGDSYGVGYTGAVQAFQPGATPAVVETWHTITLPVTGGFTGTIRVKKLAEFNFCILDVAVRWTVTTAGGINAGNLPAGYYPLTAHTFAMGVGDAPSSTTPSALIIPTSGPLQFSIAASGSGSGSAFFYGGTYVYPLD